MIGRREECKILERVMESGESEFVAVYGKRGLSPRAYFNGAPV